MSVYTENGYSNRREYLDSLRAEYGREIVDALTSIHPASEGHRELWNHEL